MAEKSGIEGKMSGEKMLIAYHGDPKVKEKYLARVRAHAAADEIIHGIYWTGSKGCAVGCTIHSDNHAAYETELGIPRIIARLEDGIFEGLSNGRSKLWPEQFLSVARARRARVAVFARARRARSRIASRFARARARAAQSFSFR